MQKRRVIDLEENKRRPLQRAKQMWQSHARSGDWEWKTPLLTTELVQAESAATGHFCAPPRQDEQNTKDNEYKKSSTATKNPQVFHCKGDDGK